jgi:trimethylamine--corrinoid protein Co-methyltransferase
MDMLTSAFLYGSPEWRLTNSAFADMYHFYGIPMWSTVGTDAHVFDQQAAMEHALGTLMAALDGANLIHDIGYLGQGLIGNPASIVMGNDIIGWVKRVIRGFDLNRETLALDVMRSVGPGGNYLAEEHTLKHFRQELWRSQYGNRLDPDTWTQRGGKTYGQVVTEATLAILETHKPEPLPEEISAALDAIIQETASALRDKRFIA